MLSAILWGIGLGTLFVASYLLNKRTPVPEGCEDLLKNAGCEGCSEMSCSYNPAKKED